ncbi:MAG TPA: hypothetical protein VGW75_12170 [Solirubrobacteraceae bacterium]|jgi:hypothetical protein|nr:hypothetical protein [Solirubrobacteraceae bacterium]
MRLAFVGQREYFDYTSLQAPAGGVEPAFVHFFPGAPVEPLLGELHRLQPDVVFVWRPELIPPQAFATLDAITVGYLTEPLPRPGGAPPHRDLLTRWEHLQRADPSNFDRIVSFDPLVAPTVDRHMRVWRSFPIPVSDTYFAPVAPPNPRPSVLFTGRSTEHRERFLGPVKKDFHTVHLAHGVTDAQLMPFLRRSDVGVNLHNEPYPTFENRVPAYLAAGLLVISEPLSPHHGLQPGRDLLEVREPFDLYELVERAARTPHAFDTVRLQGRRAAERWRASRVYPRFVKDLIADVRAFGRGRVPATLGPA